MVSSIASSSPLSYISQLIAPKSTNSKSSGLDISGLLGVSASSSGNSSTTLNTTNLGIPSELLSVLQGASNDNANLLSGLFGSSSLNSSDVGTGALEALLNQATQNSPITDALAALQAKAAQTKAQTNPLDSILSSYNSAISSYNKTLLANAQSVLADVQAATSDPTNFTA